MISVFYGYNGRFEINWNRRRPLVICESYFIIIVVNILHRMWLIICYTTHMSSLTSYNKWVENTF